MLTDARLWECESTGGAGRVRTAALGLVAVSLGLVPPGGPGGGGAPPSPALQVADKAGGPDEDGRLRARGRLARSRSARRPGRRRAPPVPDLRVDVQGDRPGRPQRDEDPRPLAAPAADRPESDGPSGHDRRPEPGLDRE